MKSPYDGMTSMKAYQKSNKAQTEKTKKYEDLLYCRYRSRSKDRGFCFEHAKKTAEGGIYLEKRSIRQEQRVRKKLAIHQRIKCWWIKGTKDRIILVQENFHLESQLPQLVHNFSSYIPMYQEEILRNAKKVQETRDIKQQKMSRVMSHVDAKNVACSDGIYIMIKKDKEEDIREVVTREQARTLPPFQTHTQKKRTSKCKDKFREQAIRDRKLEIDAIKDSSLGIHEKVCGESMDDREFDKLAERFSYEEIAQKYKNALRTRAKIRACGNEDCCQYALGLVGLTEYYILQAHREREAREARKSSQSGQSVVDSKSVIDAIRPVVNSTLWSQQAIYVSRDTVCLSRMYGDCFGNFRPCGGEEVVSLLDPCLHEKIQTHLNATASYLQQVHKAGNYMAELAKMPKLSQTSAKSSHWRNRY